MKLIYDSGNRYGVYVIRHWECLEDEINCPDCSNALKISTGIYSSLHELNPDVKSRDGWQDVRCEICDLEGQLELVIRIEDNVRIGNPILQLSNLHRREREFREREGIRRAAKKVEKAERKVPKLNSKQRRQLSRAEKQ